MPIWGIYIQELCIERGLENMFYYIRGQCWTVIGAVNSSDWIRYCRLLRNLQMKSSDAKASKCHMKFSSKMIIFIKLTYSSPVISLKWQLIGNPHCNLNEITELKYTSLIKMIILENFKWHLEAFASELFK